MPVLVSHLRSQQNRPIRYSYFKYVKSTNYKILQLDVIYSLTLDIVHILMNHFLSWALLSICQRLGNLQIFINLQRRISFCHILQIMKQIGKATELMRESGIHIQICPGSKPIQLDSQDTTFFTHETLFFVICAKMFFS